MYVLEILLVGLMVACAITGVYDANKAICDAPYFHNQETYDCHCPKPTPIAIEFLTTNGISMPPCEGHARFVEYPCELLNIWLISIIFAPIKLVQIIFR
jgi:hypothetical protein